MADDESEPSLAEPTFEEGRRQIDGPDEREDLTAAERLQLSGNAQLTALPSEIGQLPKLRSVFLHGCARLTALPLHKQDMLGSRDSGSTMGRAPSASASVSR